MDFSVVLWKYLMWIKKICQGRGRTFLFPLKLLQCWVRDALIIKGILLLLVFCEVFAEQDFQGVRFSGKIDLSRIYFAPKSLRDPLVLYAPGVSAHLKIGGVRSDGVVYFGGHAFGGFYRGKVEEHKWKVVPSYFFGGGFLTGSIVQRTFLTGFGVGLLRSVITVYSPHKRCEEKTMMGYIEIMTETLLTDRISTEVSYRYVIALSQNTEDSCNEYKARATHHMFSLGVVLSL